ncbi:hypothetical protein COY05_01505 [Candidatus Peregrinibacteria bacterium CG_4_10_14_0_2_um_filter_38_24]|nr:MAG: hypothetical protein COY05_01505 [Candidatus Peregrinibacteria bacterium CG_4_10_14_0_2_um_filter_38_24]
MAKDPIKKLNNLVHAESFLQVNFIKGYKYIDRAGEVVNLFYDEKNLPPKFQMDRNFLVIQKQQKLNEEYRLSVGDFWMHSVSPTGLDAVATNYENLVEKVLNVIDVTKINRLGWRNYFVYECDKSTMDGTHFSKLLNNSDFELSEVVFSKALSSFTFNFRISRVVKEKTPDTQGLLFDVDCFKKYDQETDVSKIKSDLKKMRETMQAEGFLAVVNFLINK